MHSFNANFVTEKNKRSDGPAPVNLLKFAFATPVYLSDRNVTPSGGPTYSGLVKSWGFIDTSISHTPGRGLLGTIETSDLRLVVINSQSPRFSDNFTDEDPPENVTVELYQWFEGLTDSEKEIIFKGVIRNQIKYDLYECQFSVKGIWEKYNKIIGEDLIISADDYPDADPDDIGKMQNIGYGQLSNVPCRCVETGDVDNLESEIDASQTSIELSDASRFSESGTIGIDAEEITYTGKSGNVLTGCTRGANSTDAAIHAQGSTVWEITDRTVFQICGHPVTSIGDIYADGLRVTSIATKYTGQSGDELAGYEGEAVVSVPGKLTWQQGVDLLIDDGLTIDDSIDVVDTIGVSTGSHAHASATQIVNFMYDVGEELTSEVLYIYAMLDHDYDTSARFGNVNAKAKVEKTYYEDYGSPPTHVRVCMYMPTYFGTGTVRAQLYDSGSVYLSGCYVDGNATGTFKSSWVSVNSYFNTWAKLNAGKIELQCISYGSDVRVAEVWLEVKFTPTTDSGPATGVAKTGSAGKDGTVTRYGAITLSGNSVAYVRVRKLVTANIEAYRDDGSGTYTGTPNALIQRCDHVFKHIWCALLGAPSQDIDTVSFTDSGTFFNTNGYTFSLLISRPVQAETLLMKLALQCRSRFFVSPAGKAKLMVRKSSQYSSHSILKNEIKQDSMSVQRTAFEDLINYFMIYYDRDHSAETNRPENYAANKPFSDATSIGRYGQQGWKGASDVFLFDAVTSESMVNHVGAFLLDYHKAVRKMPEFSVFLDNCEVEPGDIITVTHDLDAMSSFGMEVQKILHRLGSARSSVIDHLQIKGVEVSVEFLQKLLQAEYDILIRKRENTTLIS
ncbi:MAG: hypothetical protein JRJ73_15315 [Deltaproteobacteria bacterium]|nr:hypothetical protein [Deltaproteobacteria bacterium]